MSSKQKCILCDNSSETKITLFNEKILGKYREFFKIRVTYKLKYNELILPTTPDKNNGYHGNYYSNFTAIKRKYVDKYSELVKLQQSGNTIPEPDPNKYINSLSIHYFFYYTFSIFTTVLFQYIIDK